MRYADLLGPPCCAVLSLKTAPADEPISAEELAVHSRLSLTPGTMAHLETLIGAARADVELITGRQLIEATYELYLDAWPADGMIELPRPPLQGVAAVEYRDADGNFTTFAGANYTVTGFEPTDPAAPAGRIELAPGISWPTLEWEGRGGVRVTFTAGYGVAAEDVPPSARHAILLHAAELYERREAVMLGAAQGVPLGAERLVAGLRVF